MTRFQNRDGVINALDEWTLLTTSDAAEWVFNEDLREWVIVIWVYGAQSANTASSYGPTNPCLHRIGALPQQRAVVAQAGAIPDFWYNHASGSQHVSKLYIVRHSITRKAADVHLGGAAQVQSCASKDPEDYSTAGYIMTVIAGRYAGTRRCLNRTLGLSIPQGPTIDVPAR
ncbi:hypothetical protein WOLCODRAFT_146837 [Wolfiporia cocos MD-104 SS10]|uniref:Uncharacterized protein n=1 Tax=Wolfiporia cocos (strain MD-104) TaxID=742152 RepID=A0A2H3JBT7_WOLCO|nr:hypothetical protein WOLCODRAFT_146837 [Wolfiporia cocos MD-104 SS10]